mgnify:CR=1 FL=1
MPSGPSTLPVRVGPHAAPRPLHGLRAIAPGLFALALAWPLGGGAQAGPRWPPAASAACVPEAARHHGVDPWLLAAILQVESGWRPHAVSRNANGTLDVGLAQINSIHFPELARHGITPADLFEPCVASHVAAWLLARQLRTHGTTWRGLASYHSTTPCHNQRYAAQVWNTLAGWGLVRGATLAVASQQSCATAPALENRR